MAPSKQLPGEGSVGDEPCLTSEMVSVLEYEVSEVSLLRI